ncbi:hypothetical protein HDV05_001584 [Chytridiales sp. JEL 0842]|nr:hypothetical protein HDV05_001584 [Chytridiales sp. JEL 0842]
MVAMIDISGYSSITSSLTALGKLSSELITNTVGSYMDQVVTVIFAFGGDVIKFLGDAILICFSKVPGESESELAERATYCCLYVSAHLKSVSIDLSKAIQDYKRHTDRSILEATNSSNTPAVALSAAFESGAPGMDVVTLEIHVALTAGMVEHVIMGLEGKRMDYAIHGACMNDLGAILDSTTRETADAAESEPLISDLSDEAFSLLRLFLNEALLYKLEINKNLKRIQTATDNVAYAAITSLNQLGDSTLPNTISSPSPTIKKQITLNCAVTTINQTQFPSEFRSVSVIFVKLKSEFNAQNAQTIFETFVSILKKWEGTFQQFAVDDKGDTVNVAARLMSLGNHFDSHPDSIIIKCDLATYSLTKEDFGHINLGEKTVKGKRLPIQVWGVKSKDEYIRKGGEQGHRMQRGQDKSVFGYIKERNILKQSLLDWVGEAEGKLVVVEGKSGMGKSKLLDYIAQRMTDVGIQYSLSQGSEIKQYSPYLSIQSLMNFIYRRFTDMEETRADDTGARGSNNDIRHSQGTFGSRRRTYAQSRRSSLIGTKLQPSHRDQGAKADGKEKLIVKFLEAMGENASFAPLLSEVLPLATIPDTSYTKKLDPDARRNLIKSMVVRLVNKTLEIEKFGIIWDDAQWMDSASLEIVAEIIHKCPKAINFIFMRPLPENPLKTFEQILTAPKIQKMDINGLSESDVGQILLHKFAPFGIADVSPKVISVIFAKSEGSPLTIDAICESAKTDFHDIFSISAKNTLEFNNAAGEKKLDGYSTVASAVMMQFDAHFEGLIDESTREYLLPLLAYHYRKTDVIEKQILYLDELARLRFKRRHWQECANTLESLYSIVEAAPAFLGITSEQRGYWAANLAHARLLTASFTVREAELTYVALKLLGKPFARDVTNPKKELIPAILRLFCVWKQTKGGSRPLRRIGFFTQRASKQNNASKDAERDATDTDEAEYVCYQTLYTLTAYSDFMTKDTAGLLLFKLLTYSVTHGHKDRAKFAGLMFQIGFFFLWAVPPIAKFLFNHGCKVEKSLSSEESLQDMAEWYGFKGICLLNFGRLAEAKENYLKFKSFDNELEEACLVPGTWQHFNGRLLATRRIMVNDFGGAQRLVKASREHLPKNIMENERIVHLAMINYPIEIWVLLTRGEFSGVLERLEPLSKSFVSFTMPFSSAVDTITMLPLQLIMLYVGRSLYDSSTSKSHVWSKEDKNIIIDSLQRILDYLDRLACKLKLPLYAWPYTLVTSSKLMFQDQIPKARNLLVNALKKDGKILNELHMHLATSSIYLSLLVSDVNSKRSYFKNALDFYEARGHVLPAKWLQNVQNVILES